MFLVSFYVLDEYIDRVSEGSIVELSVSPIGLGSSFIFYPGNSSKIIDDDSYIPEKATAEAKELIKDGKVVGVFTLTDLVNAIANDRESETVGELMSTNVVIVNEDLKIANAIDVMLKKSISRLIIADNNQVLLGIVTRTDLIDSITNLKQFPIMTK